MARFLEQDPIQAQLWIQGMLSKRKSGIDGKIG